jgi:Tfp pilus assembly protein PilN
MSLPGDGSAEDGSAGDGSALITAEASLCVPTTPHARAKRRIAALTEEIEALKQDKAIKQRLARS